MASAGQDHDCLPVGDFEQFAQAVDDAFGRWDRSHLHEFTLAHGTAISPARRWDGNEQEGSIDGSKARLSRLRCGERFAYVFDLGDMWAHYCTVAAGLADPMETLGVIRTSRGPGSAGVISLTSTAAAGTATMARRPCLRGRTA